MKASELRLGIWVYLFGDVVQLTKDHLMYLLQKDGLPEPITLTEEWLVKFGFKKVIYEYSTHYENEHCWIYLIDPAARYTDRRPFFELELNTLGERHNLCRKYQYVHQLQNLYFALTGEELTPPDVPHNSEKEKDDN